VVVTDCEAMSNCNVKYSICLLLNVQELCCGITNVSPCMLLVMCDTRAFKYMYNRSLELERNVFGIMQSCALRLPAFSADSFPIHSSNRYKAKTTYTP